MTFCFLEISVLFGKGGSALHSVIALREAVVIKEKMGR